MESEVDWRVAAAIGVPGLYFAAVRYGSLSRNFTVWELVQSDSGGVQWPTPMALANLRTLVTKVLQPWRDLVGPLKVTSGYRHWSTNELVGGSATSDHPSGFAADVVPQTVGLWGAADRLVESTIPYDQLILYDGHLHVGYRPQGARRQLIDKRS